MLDRFKVPKEDQIRISQDSLRASVTAIFKKMGLESEDASNGDDVLVTADLRGIETHGVSNKMADYVRMYTSNMDQMLKTLRETKPAPGHDRVLYPGLSESEDEQERRANGIPLHQEVVEWFDDLTGKLLVPRLVRM